MPNNELIGFYYMKPEISEYLAGADGKEAGTSFPFPGFFSGKWAMVLLNERIENLLQISTDFVTSKSRNFSYKHLEHFV